MACSTVVAGASADTIRLGPPRAGSTHSLEIELWKEVDLGEPAFVGVVLLRGTAGSCPANYTLALSEPWALSVFAGEEHATEPPEVGSGTGVGTMLPGGAYSLCGWIQPEGDTEAAKPTATDGPLHFTVTGPVGSTEAHPPARSASDEVSVPVSYTLSEQDGELPGSATAQLGAWATRDTHGSCAEGPPRYSTMLTSAEASALSAGTDGAVEGSVNFAARFVAGEYEVCSYLLETFPQEDVGLLANALPGSMFGISTGRMTVLTHPSLSGLRVLPQVFRLGQAHAGTRFRFVLNEQATVTLDIFRLVSARDARGPRDCVADPAGRGRVCGVAVGVGALQADLTGGTNAVRFDGRVGGRAISPGVYEVRAVARAPDGAESSVAEAAFATRRQVAQASLRPLRTRRRPSRSSPAAHPG